MTWSVRIISDKAENVVGGNVCGACKHSDGCQLHKVVGPIQDMLTNLDGRCDGSWANGHGALQCHGFEAKEVEEVAHDHAAASSEGADNCEPDGEEPDGEEPQPA